MTEQTDPKPSHDDSDPKKKRQGGDRRRTGVERRSGKSRRTRRDPDFQGPDKRDGKERRAGSQRRSGLDRRRGPGKRRSEPRRAAEEGEMTDEQFEFLQAIDEYKKANSRPFPTWTEVLDVIQAIGYRKIAPRSDIQ